MILIADSTGNLSKLLKLCTGPVRSHVNCESFETALNSLHQREVCMAIVRQNLADRHGFELLSHLTLHFPTLPVIFVAEDSREETIISAMRRGARDFLEWPFGASADARRWKYHSKLNSQESCVCDSEGHHISFSKA